MRLTPLYLETLLEQHGPIFRRVKALYADMDIAYTAAAAAYGFACRGCDDNCCLTRFHHHTLLEAACLFAGYRSLPDEQKRRASERARSYCLAMQMDDRVGPPRRHLCPLNLDTRCLLYHDRPMICRLHGIPHILIHPRKGTLTGPGCHIFEDAQRGAEGRPLNRTPIYAAMAGLEKALREAVGYASPLRLTVAEMVVCFDGE